MTHGNACIIFEFQGRRYEYDGALPDEVADAVADLYDERGFWRGGYPPGLAAQGADGRDELPTALWEITHVGGTVIEVRGTRDNGAVYLEDWKRPRVY
jgi:hypothetical protein